MASSDPRRNFNGTESESDLEESVERAIEKVKNSIKNEWIDNKLGINRCLKNMEHYDKTIQRMREKRERALRKLENLYSLEVKLKVQLEENRIDSEQIDIDSIEQNKRIKLDPQASFVDNARRASGVSDEVPGPSSAIFHTFPTGDMTPPAPPYYDEEPNRDYDLDNADKQFDMSLKCNATYLRYNWKEKIALLECILAVEKLSHDQNDELYLRKQINNSYFWEEVQKKHYIPKVIAHTEVGIAPLFRSAASLRSQWRYLAKEKICKQPDKYFDKLRKVKAPFRLEEFLILMTVAKLTFVKDPTPT